MKMKDLTHIILKFEKKMSIDKTNNMSRSANTEYTIGSTLCMRVEAKTMSFNAVPHMCV